MSSIETLNEIRDRGYWRVNFRPVAPDDKLDTLADCLRAVEQSRVSTRGWDYPPVPIVVPADGRCGIHNLANCIEVWDNFREMHDYWRMYQSSQFIHLRAMDEDWFEGDPYARSQEPPPPVPPRKILGIVSTSWTVYEVFLFCNGSLNMGSRAVVSRGP